MKKIIVVLMAMIMAFTVHVVEASPMVMVEVENDVVGFVGEPMSDEVVILTLSDDHYKFHFDEENVDEDVTDWFTNIPDGLEATAFTSNSSSIAVHFSGKPKEESDEQIEVTVPEGYIIDGFGNEVEGDLSNTPSDNAVYDIQKKVPSAIYDRPSTVSGTVGEDLEAQKVYIKLINTKPNGSMMKSVLDEKNGLTGKVVDYLSSDNILVVEYTGTPVAEDHDLISITLPAARLECGIDLKVPDREDVLFDINPKETTPEENPQDEEQEPAKQEEEKQETITHIIPHTGVE